MVEIETERRLHRYAVVLVSIALVGLVGLVAPAPVRAGTLIVTNLNDGGTGSLRAQIAAAMPNDTIVFQIGLTGTINLLGVSGTLKLTKNVTILGSGASALKIDGGNSVTVFTVNPGVTATISGLTIEHGSDPNGSSGGILNNGTLTITGCVVKNNTAGNPSHPGFGGGIDNGGTLTVSVSDISNNTVNGLLGLGGGGGIYSSGPLSVTVSTISNNTAIGGSGINGGGISVTSTTTLTGTTVSNNSANDGAGIYNTNGAGTVTLYYSTVSGNMANDLGAGFLNNSGTVAITGSTFSGNTTGSQGGGFFNINGTVTVFASTFVNNFANNSNGSAAGAFYNDGGTTTVANSTVANNQANGPNSAGGAWVNAFGTLRLFNDTFSGNSVSGNGAFASTGDVYGGTVLSGNSIFFGSLTPPTVSDLFGLFMSGGHNFVDNGGGSSGWNATDLIGTTANPLNPLLGPLGSYGGPTPSMVLLPNSPAIGHGDPAICNAAPPNGAGGVDQRGIVRQPNVCSIGSVEGQPLAPSVSPPKTPAGPSGGAPASEPPAKGGPAPSGGPPAPLPVARP